MSALVYVHKHVIPMAMDLLPGKMESPPAEAMILAIGLQESRFTYRRQLPNGPAMGFWQFERLGGVRGVLLHPQTRLLIESILTMMGYDKTTQASHRAIEHNDILACIYARLLLWTHPGALPGHDDFEGSWRYYLSTWRPGKPHRETWDDFYSHAWKLTLGEA